MNADMPDLGALYLRHRDAMHKVAASVLREVGLASQAGDAVHDAIVSIMASPPNHVQNWEALLVTAAKRKALDRIRSADVRRAGPEFTESVHDQIDDDVDIAEDVATEVDRKDRAAVAWDSLSVLDDRHRKVVWDIAALERPRNEVASELGVTPGRVSQMMSEALARLRQEINRREEGNDE
ncbi:sigma-70 family RNA polymerase sigma factor [Mycobacterium sp. E735]|uniref:sigma-70 family RNA polymerase sigma factor n=1 Tax=Mycobacterium sp. E735 TaxID=1834148 RepID=UPI0007FBDFB4|nr:sigma-70 family RNA polymerase sigma factor [Mycobacterium sp. E735]OBG63320.1 RNA polymerase subunit sigma-70 [Mycobacterium sp. E735]